MCWGSSTRLNLSLLSPCPHQHTGSGTLHNPGQACQPIPVQPQNQHPEATHKGAQRQPRGQGCLLLPGCPPLSWHPPEQDVQSPQGCGPLLSGEQGRRKSQKEATRGEPGIAGSSARGKQGERDRSSSGATALPTPCPATTAPAKQCGAANTTDVLVAITPLSVACEAAPGPRRALTRLAQEAAR